MGPQRFVICDIEATGLSDDREIIEIALITIEERKVIDVYQTLVNPLCPLSDFIRDFTSISSREVEAAPKFYEIADALRVRLEGNVFVSHNTDFDYPLLQRKFSELGQELSLKTFCTLKIAQEEIPGLASYSLEALCSFFGIRNTEKHRALGDARATLELFHEIQQLRLPTRTKELFHPRHEKTMGQLTTKAGLLSLKDASGKVIRREVAFNILGRARELLVIRPENRYLLENVHSLEAKETGCALIAEIHQLNFRSYRPRWTITLASNQRGEKSFELRPIKRKQNGLWFFDHLNEAKRKLRNLNRLTREDHFIYREGEKSKEEILRHNQRIDQIIKKELFPSPHLVLLGEGREIGEKSLVLVRDGHVVGYGYSHAGPDEIFASPERFITKKIHHNMAADRAAIRYLQVLKNLRTKSETWRAVPEASLGVA